MRSTLFYIPPELFDVPLFGVGWVLGVWTLVGVALLWCLVRMQGWNRDTASYVPFLLVVAGAIVFLLPNMVEVDPSGKPLGIPVRGFGVMLMLATIAGVGLGVYRARQMGLDPEVMYSLAFCMFLAGIVGARLFYVVQNWQEEFQQPTIAATLGALLNVTKGGLVVFGSVLAALPVGIWFLRKRGLPVLAIADVIAPSMVVGQAIGRIGCFLNGCCFGGVCLTAPYAMTFPAESPPYVQHEAAGWRSGVWLEVAQERVRVAYIAPQSAAANKGLKPNDIPLTINGASFRSLAEARQLLAAGKGIYEIETADGRVHRWTAPEPPARSVPIHPTQLYAAVDAALLALVLWFYYPYRRRDGEVFALLVTLHPISRFVLETIRSDEPGQFGTEWTISQWLSVAILAGACLLWWYIERQPRGSALPLAGARS
ncbi:MAG: prolipoprotein diacylglyceryl transferase family protein [Pirellulaceae bacterium]